MFGHLLSIPVLYMPQYDTRAMAEFVDELSNWYVRRSRERFWAKGMEQDKVNAYMTLYTVLDTVVTSLIISQYSSGRPCPAFTYIIASGWRFFIAAAFLAARPSTTAFSTKSMFVKYGKLVPAIGAYLKEVDGTAFMATLRNDGKACFTLDGEQVELEISPLMFHSFDNSPPLPATTSSASTSALISFGGYGTGNITFRIPALSLQTLSFSGKTALPKRFFILLLLLLLLLRLVCSRMSRPLCISLFTLFPHPA